MSILIEGVSLPQKGKGETLMLSVFSSGSVDYKLYSESTNHRTIAIALPLEHGRLIDADKLMEKVRETADFPSHEWCKAIECLEDAPTVIEASV